MLAQIEEWMKKAKSGNVRREDQRYKSGYRGVDVGEIALKKYDALFKEMQQCRCKERCKKKRLRHHRLIKPMVRYTKMNAPLPLQTKNS